jgi:hypothetical protein
MKGFIKNLDVFRNSYSHSTPEAFSDLRHDLVYPGFREGAEDDEKCVGREKGNGESFSIHIRNGFIERNLLTNFCNMFHAAVQGTRQSGQKFTKLN